LSLDAKMLGFEVFLVILIYPLIFRASSSMDCYGFCKSKFRVLNFGLFRCLNPRLLISGLIAFRVLINPRLSMDSMENEYFLG
jgi:hypothetical protein